MSKLPFVIEPRLAPRIERIGSQDSGIIEIERRGYLTSGEKNFVQQVTQSDKGTLELIELARLISKDLNQPLETAYNLLIAAIMGEGTDSSDNNEIITKIQQGYGSQIQEVVKQVTIAKSREELVMAACLITHRINREFEIQDIMEVHPDIISDLAQLYRDEEAKSIARLTDQESEQEEGKEPVNIEKIEKKPKATRST